MRDDSTWKVRASWLAGCALVSAACAAEAEPPFEPRYETERLRIGTSFEVEVCRGVMDVWEAQIDAIEAMLGVSREFAWLYLYADDESNGPPLKWREMGATRSIPADGSSN